MQALSENGEVLIDQCVSGDNAIDTLVVGSGYGGAVAALRFAEHGVKVYVLERGNEYVSGEFPNDLSQVGKHIRADILTTTGVKVQGYETGLFDIRLGEGVGALVGNGLGGGSLINAAIGLRADRRVFESESWPSALRGLDLSKYYDIATKELELQTPGKGLGSKNKKEENSQQDDALAPKHLEFDPAETKKFKRLQEIYSKAKTHLEKEDQNLEVTFEPLPMAIQLESDPPQDLGKRLTCNGCGDCVTGCNYHAKLSLTATYLPKAVKNGAKIFTGLTVLDIKENPEFNPKADGLHSSSHKWIVTFIRTAERDLWHQINNSDVEVNALKEIQNPDHWTYKIYARNVVLSAGTFGSTEILLRSRKHGLKVSSSALGMGFSGNGDDISFAFGMDNEVNGIGNAAHENPTTLKVNQTVGPTASGVIYFKHKKDVTRSSLMEDGAIPSLMSRLFGELTQTLGTVIQMSDWSFRRTENQDHLTVSQHSKKHTLGLLGMGHDTATGMLVLDSISNRLALAWPNVSKESSPILHKIRQAVVKKTGAIFIQNPATGVLPDEIADNLSGDRQQTRLVTVHPLGGCRMGDNAYTGVVNHWGAVFKDDGKSVNEIFEGLFVLDGSIIPSSVGVNPMLTITAMAERACESILLAIPKRIPSYANLKFPLNYPTPLEISTKNTDTASETRLCEVLRCELADLSDTFKTLIGLPHTSTGTHAALFVEMDIPNWDQVLSNPKHKVKVISTDCGENRFTRTRLVIDTRPFLEGVHKYSAPEKEGSHIELKVNSGTVSIFALKKSSIFCRVDLYIRIFLTYLLGRWIPDIIKSSSKSSFTFESIWHKCLNAFKLVAHATEIREFIYKFELEFSNKSFELIGRKTIVAGASWSEIGKFIGTYLLTRNYISINKLSVWEQLTQVNVHLIDTKTRKDALTGIFSMDFPAMIRSFAPQLGVKDDSITSLISFMSYPLLLVRGIVKTRLLDFRLPDYKIDHDDEALPFIDPALVTKPAGYKQHEHLQEKYIYPPLNFDCNSDPVLPEIIPFYVRFSVTSPEPDTELMLIRYRQPNEIQTKNCKADKASKRFTAKSIILTNGFALTTHAFVATELKEKSLAAMLYKQGWDVWLFEYRASPVLDVSAKYTTIDDIAKFDIPTAVDVVIERVSEEMKQQNPEINKDNLQIHYFSHCIGSASLMMSLLSGCLRHQDDTSKIASILISQFLPFPIGSKTTQVKLQLSNFIRDVLNIDLLQFTAGQEKPNAMYQFIDRVFSSFNYQAGNTFSNEQCHQEKENLCAHQPDTTSCKRMSGIFGRSMVHDNLLPETHKKLDLYFGRANVGVFLQGAKCVEYEQLVNMDGQNVYVSDENIVKYLDMPVMVLHGENNVLFDKESFKLTQSEFRRIFSSDRSNAGQDRFLLAKGYAHFDCTIGKNAHKEIFSPVIDFFNESFKPEATLTSGIYHPSLPLTGPYIGWVREEGDQVKCRVWFEVENDRKGFPNQCVGLTRVQYGENQIKTQLWKVYQQAIRTSVLEIPEEKLFKIYFCVVDLVIPKSSVNEIGLKIECLGLNKIQMGPGRQFPLPNYQKVLERYGYCVDETKFIRNKFDAIEPIFEIDDSDTVNYLFKESEAIYEGLSRRANAAKPNTLIRRVLDLKEMNKCSVRLAKSQLIPNPDCLSFVAAGCRHSGLTGFERDRSDFTLRSLSDHIKKSHPSFMLMMGDQVYVDSRAGILDKSTLIERLIPKYRQAFSSDGFRAVASQLPLYMAIDDHEIKDNWSTEMRYLSNENIVAEKNAKSAFFVYQRVAGPARNPNGSGFDYTLKNAGFEFFNLDTRTAKTRVPKRKILRPSQWESLTNWLIAQDKDKPKFIMTSSVIIPGLIENQSTPTPRQADNWQMAENEINRLFELINRLEMNNVVFISSDYHCAAVSRINIGDRLEAFAIVAPALHAPMRFSNTLANELLVNQEIQIAEELIVKSETQSWNGEGWVDIQVNQKDKELNFVFNLKDFGESSFTKFKRNFALKNNMNKGREYA